MQKDIVCGIDIGHGSDTFERTGGKGVWHNGKAYEEHTFNSAVAIELDKLLIHNGFRTIMYQQPMAKEVSLSKRTDYYNAKNVDLVWSIHANAGSHSANGACSFYWHSNSDTKKLAEYFADFQRKAGYNTHGNGTHASVVGSWTNMHMVREPKADAILTENGFMTNPVEFKEIFLDENYPKAMARVHAQSICKYFNVTFKDIPKKTNQVADLYRVRKSWKDIDSQIGAYSVLENAIEKAKEHSGYEVYSEDGIQVFPKMEMYRVRKSWSDEDSQIGAYTIIDNAKELADDNDGYVVFDSSGKTVYTPKVDEPELYRVRKDWEDAESQIGAYSVLTGAKEKADEVEGYNVYNSNGELVYEGKEEEDDNTPTPPKEDTEPTPEPKPVDPHKDHDNIMGESKVSADKMVAYIRTINKDALNIEEIAKSFIEVGEKYGVRGDIAFCQSMIETGWFRFDMGTAVTPDQHNYCGMGVTSKGMKGNSFETVRDGVTAQVQHLYAYANKLDLPSGEKLLDPRYKLVSRGIAPHWQDLNMRWAMNDNYGQHIMSIYNKLLDYNYVEPIKEEPIPVEPPVEPVIPPTEPPVEEESKDDEKANFFKKMIDYFFEKIKELLKGGK